MPCFCVLLRPRFFKRSFVKRFHGADMKNLGVDLPNCEIVNVRTIRTDLDYGILMMRFVEVSPVSFAGTRVANVGLVADSLI